MKTRPANLKRFLWPLAMSCLLLSQGPLGAANPQLLMSDDFEDGTWTDAWAVFPGRSGSVGEADGQFTITAIKEPNNNDFYAYKLQNGIEQRVTVRHGHTLTFEVDVVDILHDNGMAVLQISTGSR